MGSKEDHDAPVFIRRMRQDVHQVVAPEGPPEDTHGREAVPVLVEGVRMEIRPLRRTHPPLSQTHGRQAVSVPTMRTRLLPFRSLGAAHETAHHRLI